MLSDPPAQPIEPDACPLTASTSSSHSPLITETTCAAGVLPRQMRLFCFVLFRPFFLFCHAEVRASFLPNLCLSVCLQATRADIRRRQQRAHRSLRRWLLQGVWRRWSLSSKRREPWMALTQCKRVRWSLARALANVSSCRIRLCPLRDAAPMFLPRRPGRQPDSSRRGRGLRWQRRAA